MTPLALMRGLPAILLVWLPGVVDAGEVRGRVEVTSPRVGEEWVSVQKHREVCGERRALEGLRVSSAGGLADGLVELEGLSHDASRRPRPAVVLDNRDCRFVPRVQIAAVGASLEIRNSDPVLHTAHAYRPADESVFHVALPHFREQVRVALDTPGLLRIVCDVGHVWMRAYILVTDNPFAVVTDGEGRFVMGEVPAGRYQLRVWHERLGTITAPVTVPAVGEAVVELRYP